MSVAEQTVSRSANPSGSGTFPGTSRLDQTSLTPWLVLFLLCVLIPGSFTIGGTMLTPLRILLLVTCVPFTLQILAGKVGRATPVDWLLLGFAFWILLSLIVVHGASRIPYAIINAVEIVGGYVVGRYLIRSAQDYRRLFLFLLIAIVILVPFAMVENVTGKLVIPELLRPILNTPYRGDSAYGRMGFERAYVVFAHPIHWGLFCSLTMANWVMMRRKSVVTIVVAIAFSFFTTMLALSSAPLLSCSLQILLLGWQWVTKGRWKLFIILAVSAYIFVDMASNRTPITILIGSLTFNPMSGFVRMAVFEYAWAAILNSPVFGIGFNEWARPGWVTGSVDNFWLVNAMRSGLPGAGLVIAAFVVHLLLMMRAKVGSEDTWALQVGHGIALVGISFTLITVHIWGALAVFVMFYLGAGAWIYAYDQSGGDQEGGQPAAGPMPDPRAIRYTRFPPAGPGAAASGGGTDPVLARSPLPPFRGGSAVSRVAKASSDP